MAPGATVGAMIATARAAFLAFLVAATLAAQESERFALFNDCRPMSLSVGVEGERFPDLRERIHTMAESRLRAARLYPDSVGEYLAERFPGMELPGRAHLGLAVTIVGAAFSTSLTYEKRMLDRATNDESWGLALDGIRASTGTHGGNAAFVLQGLSEALDGFIADYLRVNGSHC